MTAINDITKAPISNFSKGEGEQYNLNFDKVFGERPVRLNPRFFPHDHEQLELTCLSCEKVFVGGGHRGQCALCS